MTTPGTRGRRAVLGACLAVGLVATACSTSTLTSSTSSTRAHRRATASTRAHRKTATSTSTSTTSAATRTGAAAGPTSTAVTWLCRPGMAGDPCASNLTATSVNGGGHARLQYASDATQPAIDCFYVPSMASPPATKGGGEQIDAQAMSVAVTQAARFSQVCNVYAPLYRNGTPAFLGLPYVDVLEAWRSYLADDNHGRGFALIGDAQGASLLVTLLQHDIDPYPSLRSRLVGAVLLGTNVTVPVGKTVGGSFQHIPACTDVLAPGCVIAFSSFDRVPPSNSVFGRSDPATGRQVLCVNPAVVYGDATRATAVSPAAADATGAGPALPAPTPLVPYFPTAASLAAGSSPFGFPAESPAPATPWVTYPRLYTARCETDGAATWLQVETTQRRGDTRPVVSEVLGPARGLQLDNVNLDLGDLVSDLRAQAVAYGHAH